MRLEIGAGEKPSADYDLHVDVLPLPGIAVVCRMDELPFRVGGISALRANHILEHQSYELVADTVREWFRVLQARAEVYIGVPDARHIAEQWVRGDIDTREANYWMLGGHSDRQAHRGADDRGVPRWIWNAHHTLFDADWLRELLEECGLKEVEVRSYAIRNLCGTGRIGVGAMRGSGPQPSHQ